MRYNIHQQALLKQAFDIVALALANSPAPDVIDSAEAVKTSAVGGSLASHFFAQLPYEQSQHDIGAVTDRANSVKSAPEPPLQVIAAQAASVLAPTIPAQHFFSGLPWDLYKATQDAITTQPASLTQMTAGDWFSRIDWQSSKATDPDVQSFAQLATSTALHTASRAVDSAKP